MKKEISIQPVIDGIKSKFPDVVKFKKYKGQNKKEGHVLLRVYMPDNLVVNIDIDVVEMLQNKTYFDGIFDDIYHKLTEARAEGYELRKIITDAVGRM